MKLYVMLSNPNYDFEEIWLIWKQVGRDLLDSLDHLVSESTHIEKYLDLLFIDQLYTKKNNKDTLGSSVKSL